MNATFAILTVKILLSTSPETTQADQLRKIYTEIMRVPVYGRIFPFGFSDKGHFAYAEIEDTQGECNVTLADSLPIFKIANLKTGYVYPKVRLHSDWLAKEKNSMSSEGGCTSNVEYKGEYQFREVNKLVQKYGIVIASPAQFQIRKKEFVVNDKKYHVEKSQLICSENSEIFCAIAKCTTKCRVVNKKQFEEYENDNGYNGWQYEISIVSAIRNNVSVPNDKEAQQRRTLLRYWIYPPDSSGDFLGVIVQDGSSYISGVVEISQNIYMAGLQLY